VEAVPVLGNTVRRSLHDINWMLGIENQGLSTDKTPSVIIMTQNNHRQEEGETVVRFWELCFIVTKPHWDRPWSSFISTAEPQVGICPNQFGLPEIVLNTTHTKKQPHQVFQMSSQPLRVKPPRSSTHHSVRQMVDTGNTEPPLRSCAPITWISWPPEPQFASKKQR
jgi:hypothetical protein